MVTPTEFDVATTLANRTAKVFEPLADEVVVPNDAFGCRA